MGREKKEENIEVGRRLHDARKNLGYTQAYFAELLSITDEHYRKIESGVSGLTIEKMQLLYQKASIDPTYLIVGENKKEFDLEYFIANSSRGQRNQFIKRMLAYMERIMTE